MEETGVAKPPDAGRRRDGFVGDVIAATVRDDAFHRRGPAVGARGVTLDCEPADRFEQALFKAVLPIPATCGGEIHRQRDAVSGQYRRAGPFAAAGGEIVGKGGAVESPAIGAVAGQVDARGIVARFGIVEPRRGEEEPVAAPADDDRRSVDAGDLPHVPEIVERIDRHDIGRRQDRQPIGTAGRDGRDLLRRPSGAGAGGQGQGQRVAPTGKPSTLRSRTDHTATAAQTINTPHRVSTLRGSPPSSGS